MSQEAVEKLKKKLAKVKVGSSEYWLAEGDLLLTNAQLMKYAEGGQANAPMKKEKKPDELLAMSSDGKVLRWKPGLVLSYTVRKSSFKTDADYKLVRDRMHDATAQWERVCEVKFQHVPDVSAADVLFVVELEDTGGQFIAAAFFPDWEKERRRVIIDPTYFTTTFDKTGVLRHELGHVLGFRHEHIREDAPAECRGAPDDTPDDTFPLDAYNPQSVMHYFCGGVGNKDLKITEKDVAAAQRLYGMPISQLKYVE